MSVFVIRMSGNRHIYEAWAEKTISGVRGCRVLHFYLASTSGSPPLLAVVGFEKNDRHFSYEVSDNYLKVFGSSPAINARTKWTSRRIMIDWLRSLLVRKDNLPLPNSGINSCNHFLSFLLPLNLVICNLF